MCTVLVACLEIMHYVFRTRLGRESKSIVVENGLKVTGIQTTVDRMWTAQEHLTTEDRGGSERDIECFRNYRQTWLRSEM